MGLLLALTAAACGGEAESREDATGDVSSPEAEVRTNAEVVERPAFPTPAVTAGTLLTFEVEHDVSTSSHEPGDGFGLVLAEDVQGTEGAVLPAGTQARGVVSEARASSSSDEEALLAVRVRSVEVNGTQRPVDGQVESAAIRGSTGDSGTQTAAKIATGAAAGAMIGQILGGNTRSTVHGAAVGTAAGVGVALTTRGGHAELPRGTRISVRLDQDLEL